MFKNACVCLLVCSFVFSASSVKADDDDFSVEDGINLGKAIVDLATNGGKGWGPPGGGGGGGGGGWPGGGSGGFVTTPNGTPVYAGQTVYENGYKYWRCGNPSCYKLHSQFVGGGGGGGGWSGGGGGWSGGGGGWSGGGISPTYSLGVTIKSIGNGVTITGFNQAYNRFRLDIGDRIIAARLPSGQVVPINTINDLRRAKDISGPTGQLQVRVRKTNGFVLYKTLILAGGGMSAEVVGPEWSNEVYP